MNDVVLPLTLAFAVSALAYLGLAVLFGLLRDWSLRKQLGDHMGDHMGDREAASSRP